MARVHGESRTENITPTVKLVSMMENPVGTLFSIWHGSRFNEGVDAAQIQLAYDVASNQSNHVRCPEVLKFVDELSDKLIKWYPEFVTHPSKDEYKLDNAESIIERVSSMAVKANLPPADSLMMVFEIDDVTAAWRNQLVRSRLGMQQFWTMTSRTMDLTQMDVNMLPSVSEAGSEAEKIYADTVDTVRKCIKDLVDLGVPVEDIRLTPDAMTHRVYWTCSIRILGTIIPKRISWIAQASLWSPIVSGIMEVLSNRCRALVNYLGTPSDVVIKDNKIISHKYDNENYDRYVGKDYQPCDPLWLAYRGFSMPEGTDIEMYDNLKKIYIDLWSDEVLDVLGWDRLDPNKLGPYDRPGGLSKLLNSN